MVNVGQAQSSGPGVTVEGRTASAEPYETIVERARRLLEWQVEQIRESGGRVVETHLRIGSPPYEVVGLSDEIGADMIVVGSGRPRAVRRAVSGTIRRAAIGAVADYIVRSAHCPVLDVRGDGILRSVVPPPRYARRCPRRRARGHRRPARRGQSLGRSRESANYSKAPRPDSIVGRSVAALRFTWRWDSVCWYTCGPMKVIVEEIETLVSRAGMHPIWGYSHCLRVFDLAEELARAERLDYDQEILRLSALLHDIGLYRAYSLREGADHTRRSMAVATRMLRDGDFPPQATRVVLEAIEHHPPGAPPGRSTEAALLKDAVALDYLGAVGLGRVFAMVGLEEDVPDLAAAVRHAMSLRRTLPDLLHFDASRHLAHERVLEMDRFFANLENATNNLKLL